ncbi:MAG: LamG domain-containing protein, partial [Planctomycetota bacterium]
MCGKLTYLVFSVLALSMAASASGGLVAHWRLDEGSGTTAYDSAGSNQGTLNGDPKWSTGPAGGVLEFDGDDYVDIPSGVTELGAANFTIAAWIKTSETGMAILSKSNGDTGWSSMEKQLYVADSATSEGDNDGTVEYVGWGCDWIRGSIRVDDGQWHHVAVTWNMDEGSGHAYVDGVEGTYEVGFNGGSDNAGDTIRIGFSPGEHSADFIGQIDDVRIYDHILSEVEILNAMQGEIWPYAWGPEPADGALLSDTWTTLSWKPGGYAVSNDVYLGDKFD